MFAPVVRGVALMVDRKTDMPINTTTFSHVRLTVTDIDRSRAFYDTIFGWPIAVEQPADADPATQKHYAFLFGGIIYQLGGSLFGLRPVAADSFDADRVGLDHLCFAVDSYGALQDAATTLDENGVAHEEIKDIGDAYILEFRDPDNISLELMAPKS